MTNTQPLPTPVRVALALYSRTDRDEAIVDSYFDACCTEEDAVRAHVNRLECDAALALARWLAAADSEAEGTVRQSVGPKRTLGTLWPPLSPKTAEAVNRSAQAAAAFDAALQALAAAAAEQVDRATDAAEALAADGRDDGRDAWEQIAGDASVVLMFLADHGYTRT